MRAFEHRHVITLDETNAFGNVYYTHPVRWQGRCRELFLRENAPDLLKELEHGLALVTLRASCEYYVELLAFDELAIRMRLASLGPHRMSLVFDYWRCSAGGEELAARGEQEIACMRRREGKLEPESWPAVLREALRPYGPE